MKQPMIITNSIVINAPASKIWDALTNPEQTRKYMFGCAAVSDWSPGSPLLWKGVFDGKEIVAVKGHIKEIEKNERLVYTVFDPNSTIEDVPENYTTVTCTLIPQGNQTRLTVSQGDFATVAEGERRYNDSLEGGGWSSILEKIKEILE